MNTELIKVRVLSFFYSVASLILTALAGLLLSPEFATVVQEHWGSGVVGMVILMAVTELAKHIRNVRVVGKARRISGYADRENVTII